MALTLSPRQQNAVAAAITILAVFVILAAVAGIVYLLGAFLREYSRVFLPLAVAGVAALVVNPYFEWLRDRLRLPSAAALAVVFLSLLIPLGAFFWFFGSLVAEQVGDLVRRFPEWWRQAQEWFREHWPDAVAFFEEHPLGQRLRGALQAQQEEILDGLQTMGGKALSAGAGVFRAVGTILAWAVLPVYFAFFLLIDKQKVGGIDRYLPFFKAETRQDMVYLAREFVNILVSFFRGQLIVAFLMGVLFAVGFSIVGLRYGFILGLVLGFLNIIPYLGSIVGMAVALPLAFFQDGGGMLKVVLVIGVFTLVQLIEGYFLTPKIMGDRTGLHPMVIILAVFFWGTALNGIFGMILAIPLTAFLVVFWRLAREKYIREWV